MSQTPRVGLYLGPETIVRNPGYLEALRDQIGLNWVILSYTGELPPDVAEPRLGNQPAHRARPGIFVITPMRPLMPGTRV